MPLKRPKADKLPKPFRDIEADHSEADHFRIIRMQRELDAMAGVSWNQPKHGFFQRLAHMPRYRIWAILPAFGMGVLLVAGLVSMSSAGIVPPRVLWVESWSAERSSGDAVADRAMVLAGIRDDIRRTLRVVEPKAATDEEAATHAAALRRYEAMIDQEEKQREKELAARNSGDAGR